MVNGPTWAGLHHFGFVVDDLDAFQKKVEDAGGMRLGHWRSPRRCGLAGCRTNAGQRATPGVLPSSESCC
jgi:hypothetical protein